MSSNLAFRIKFIGRRRNFYGISFANGQILANIPFLAAMKALALLCSQLLFLPHLLVGQDSLLLRQMEWGWVFDDSAFAPSKEILFAYDDNGRLVEQWSLRVPSKGDHFRLDSHSKIRWNDAGFKVQEIRELYSTVSELLSARDSLVWAYDPAGRTTVYQLIRFRPQDSVEEGYRYTFAYDNKGCETSRAGREWRQDLQQFVPFDSVRTTRRADCLPEKQWIYGRSGQNQQLSLRWLYRFEYEFDVAGRPVAERQFHMENGLPPEELVSEYRLFYGPGSRVSTFFAPLTGHQSRDSILTDQLGRTIFEKQWSTSFSSDGSLVPVQQFTYTYLPGGGQIKERLHYWDPWEGSFKLRTIDSLDLQPGWRRSSRTTDFIWANGFTDRREYRSTQGPLRCDGKILSEESISVVPDGGHILPLNRVEYTYAAAPACEQPREPSPELVIFPNPSQGSLHLRSDLLHNGDVRVLVINALGMVVWEERPRVQAGIDLVLPALPAGWYSVSVEVNGQWLSKKVWISP